MAAEAEAAREARAKVMAVTILLRIMMKKTSKMEVALPHTLLALLTPLSLPILLKHIIYI